MDMLYYLWRMSNISGSQFVVDYISIYKVILSLSMYLMKGKSLFSSTVKNISITKKIFTNKVYLATILVPVFFIVSIVSSTHSFLLILQEVMMVLEFLFR